MFQCILCHAMVRTNRAFSSSNVTNHYEAKYITTRTFLTRLNAQNGSEEILKAIIQEARDKQNKRMSARSIRSFFPPATARASQPVDEITTMASSTVTVNILQAIALFLYSCITETSFTSVA